MTVLSYAEARRIALQQLGLVVRGSTATDDDRFPVVFHQAQQLLGLDDQALADKLKVSRPTVNRWARGKNLPHPFMRKPILQWVANEVESQIRLIGTGERREEQRQRVAEPDRNAQA